MPHTSPAIEDVCGSLAQAIDARAALDAAREECERERARSHDDALTSEERGKAAAHAQLANSRWSQAIGAVAALRDLGRRLYGPCPHVSDVWHDGRECASYAGHTDPAGLHP